MTTRRAPFGWILLGAAIGSVLGSVVEASLGQPAGAGFFWAMIYLPVEIVVALATATITFACFRLSARRFSNAVLLPSLIATVVGATLFFTAFALTQVAVLVWPLGFFLSLAAAILVAVLRRRTREPQRPPGFDEPLEP